MAQGDRTAVMKARYRRLLEEPSTAARAETAAAIAQEFSTGELSERERRIAADILGAMAQDVERQVRWALAEHVKACPLLPRGIAQKLAKDVESVALPVLQFSSVLTDQDLIDLVREGRESKQIAIARRSGVSTQVSQSLIETGCERVVGTLLANHHAEISDQGFAQIMADFPKNREIHGLVVGRPYLPMTTIERLITLVSDELRAELIEGHGFPCELAEILASAGREKALSEGLCGGEESDIRELVRALNARQALTPTLILRWLCLGDLRFFQVAMAELAEIPVKNAGILAFEQGRQGLKSLFEQAGLPANLFAAFRVAVEVIKEGEADRLATARRIVERLGREYDSVCPEGLEKALSQLSVRISEHVTTPIRGIA